MMYKSRPLSYGQIVCGDKLYMQIICLSMKERKSTKNMKSGDNISHSFLIQILSNLENLGPISFRFAASNQTHCIPLSPIDSGISISGSHPAG
jgi:hypothetical protein